MKTRFIALFLSMVLLFPCTVFATEAPLSPSLELIRKGLKLNKCGISGTSITFSSEDFLQVTGGDFDYLTVTKLPPLENGILKLAGIDVLKGQSISKQALDYLKFVPSSACGNELSFSFSVSNKEFKNQELECSLHYFGSLNFAPVVSSTVFETYEGLTLNASLPTYDPEGDSFTLTVESYPQNGTLKLNTDGSFVYSPKDGASGKDSFIYCATDEYGNRSVCGSATINICENKSGIYFADMKEKDSHMAAIKLAEAEVTTYTLIGDSFYFSPEENVTRADFTVMLLSAMGNETKAWAESLNLPDCATFDDISHLSEGRQKFINAAAKTGIVETKESFRPLEPITKAEALEMINNALKDNASSLNKTPFVDKLSADETALTKENAALLLCAAFD